MNEKQIIAVEKAGSRYPTKPPFHPDVNYPEYALKALGNEKNTVYESVRGCFHMAKLDVANYGNPDWNPLKKLISAGDTVLLKPNLVKENHPRNPQGWSYVLTHGSVVRAVADYIWKALEGKGKIIVADAPQTDSSFDAIVSTLGLDVIRDFYRCHGMDFELMDLRSEEWASKEGVIVSRRRLPGDSNGYIAFDLGEYSEFTGHDGAGRYYGADYNAEEVNRHHSNGRHEYLIAASAIKCDVVFSLPKFKTHKKAGITVSLKNLVGINGDKNWLPHHTEGNPSSGGDEHPSPNAKHRTERTLVPYFRQLALRVPGVGPWLFRQAKRVGIRVFGDTEEVIRSGNWWGNDTVWRMCLDLNKILLYGRSDGQLNPPKPENRRRHLSLVDGIIAGEGRGPMNPDPVYAGLLAFGINPASVDAACAVIMGFDPDKIPIVRNAFRCQHYPIAEWDWRDVVIVSNRDDWNGRLADISYESTLHFEPHFGWKGHIEGSKAEGS